MGLNKFMESERLFLAPISIDDVSTFMDCMNDEETRILARSRRDIINELNGKEMVERLQKDEEGFIICKKENDQKIGYTLIMDKDLYNREASLAIVIGKKENRGKGFGEETMKMVLKHAFIDLNLESIYLGVYEYNVKAIKLYERVGFKHVGKRRHAKILGNKMYNEVIMDMVSEEYFKLYGNEEMGKYTL
jgi:RimJ/RimL family protein N-acetyltransferase